MNEILEFIKNNFEVIFKIIKINLNDFQRCFFYLFSILYLSSFSIKNISNEYLTFFKHKQHIVSFMKKSLSLLQLLEICISKIVTIGLFFFYFIQIIDQHSIELTSYLYSGILWIALSITYLRQIIQNCVLRTKHSSIIKWYKSQFYEPISILLTNSILVYSILNIISNWSILGKTLLIPSLFRFILSAIYLFPLAINVLKSCIRILNNKNLRLIKNPKVIINKLSVQLRKFNTFIFNFLNGIDQEKNNKQE